MELVEQRHQVFQAAPQPVQPPHDDGVHLPPPGVCHEAVEGGTAVLGSADALIHVLDGYPVTGRNIAPEFGELVLRFLIEGRDPCIERCTAS